MSPFQSAALNAAPLLFLQNKMKWNPRALSVLDPPFAVWKSNKEEHRLSSFSRWWSQDHATQPASVWWGAYVLKARRAVDFAGNAPAASWGVWWFSCETLELFFPFSLAPSCLFKDLLHSLENRFGPFHVGSLCCLVFFPPFSLWLAASFSLWSSPHKLAKVYHVLLHRGSYGILTKGCAQLSSAQGKLTEIN